MGKVQSGKANEDGDLKIYHGDTENYEKKEMEFTAVSLPGGMREDDLKGICERNFFMADEGWALPEMRQA